MCVCKSMHINWLDQSNKAKQLNLHNMLIMINDIDEKNRRQFFSSDGKRKLFCVLSFNIRVGVVVFDGGCGVANFQHQFKNQLRFHFGTYYTYDTHTFVCYSFVFQVDY